MRRRRGQTPTQFAKAVLALHARLVAELPLSDPGDLLLIAQSLLRPIGTGRRFFLRKLSGGGHVF